MISQLFEVFPSVLFRHPAVRALNVVDKYRPGINTGYVETSSGLNQNLLSCFEHVRDKRMNGLLQKRFAAGDFHKWSLEFEDFGQYVLNRDPTPLMKSVLGIAIHTSKITGRQTDENTGISRERRLSLYAVEDFVD